MRLRAVMAELTSYVLQHGNGKHKRMGFVLRRIANDVIEELGEDGRNEEDISVYFANMGKVISWIGTGNDDDLPESIREFLMARAGSDEPIGEIEDVVVVPDGVDTELSGTNT
jgi:hypothetical protein